MQVFRSIAVALAVFLVTGTGPALAGSTVAEKTYEEIRREWEKARAAGGYGNPFTAVPRAVLAAFAGDARERGRKQPPRDEEEG